MNKTTPDSPARNASGHLTRPEVILGLGILVLAVVARFMPRSGLWLDEALSVNISTESLGDIGTRLRADGHPPLYYALLHFWTNLGGTGDWWVRALSGVISVIVAYSKAQNLRWLLRTVPLRVGSARSSGR